MFTDGLVCSLYLISITLFSSQLSVFCTTYDDFSKNDTCVFPESQYQALYDFYISLHGEYWFWGEDVGDIWNFTGGSMINNPCVDSWQGVSCQYFFKEVYNCEISSLTLDFYNLSGALPQNMGFLSTLDYLSLSSNHISGSIPSSFANFTFLTYLDISSNYISGNITSSITNCSILEVIYLDNNYISGEIPRDIGRLRKLSMLDLSSNELTGKIPPSIVNITSLNAVVLSNNKLTGSLPQNIGYAFPGLYQLNINTNFITGLIPSSITQLKNLQDLYFYQNCLSGSLPSDFGNLSSLVYFQAAENPLTGLFPASIANISTLQQITLFGTEIEGPIPESINNLKVLNLLNIRSNFMDGTLPETLFLISALQQIYISKNFFHGQLASFMGNTMPLLQDSWFYGNIISGTIPSSIVNSTLLYSFLIHQNVMTGHIPDNIGLMVSAQQLQWYQNFLSGSIPKSIGDLKLLFQLSLDDNLLTGTLPSSLKNLTEIEILSFSSNQLSGPLSNVFSNESYFPYLGEIQAGFNQFTGTIPSAIFDLPLIEFLGMSVNCFSGTLPENICKPKLVQLELNGLSCSDSCHNYIFPKVFNIDTYTLYGDGAHIDGNVPLCLFSMSSLEALYLSGNQFKVSLTEENFPFIGVNLKNLSLSHNILTGSIPSSIQQHEWEVLDLSYNRLSGELTPDFKVTNRTSLSLEVNYLSGNIPAEFLDLQSISILDGNIFSCGLDRASSLPMKDPSYNHYQCGSNLYNVVVYVWLGVALGIPVLLFMLYIVFSSSLERENCCSSHIQTIFDFFNEIKQVFSDSMSLFNDSSAYLNLGASVSSAYIILEVGKQFRVFRFKFIMLSLLLIFIIMPVYGVLRKYYSTHSVLYAWALSGLYLQGLASTIVLFIILFGIILLCLSYIFHGDHSIELKLRDFTANLIRESRDIRGIIKDSEKKRINQSGVTNPMKSRASATSAQESMLTAATPSSTPSTTAASAAAAAADSRDNSFFRTSNTIIERGTSFFDSKRGSSARKAVINGAVIIAFNIAIVVIVNACFIYVYLNSSAPVVVVVNVALAVFKLIWTNSVFYVLNKQVYFATRDILVAVFARISRFSELSSSLGFLFNENSYGMATVLLVLNNVALPIITMTCVNTDCFYNVFQPSPPIDVTYTQATGEFCNSIDCFSKNGLATYSTQFAPPFAYSYQCSSSIITAYAPVFAIVFLFDAFFRPIKTILVLLYINLFSTSSAAAETASALPEESAKSQLSQWKRWLWKNVLLDEITRDISSDLTVDTRSDLSLLDTNNLVLAFSNQISVLLSWGVVFPPLVPIILLAMLTRSYHFQVGFGRLLLLSHAKKFNSYRLMLEIESLDIFPNIQLSVYPVLTISCLLYSLLLFDTLGEAEGAMESYWVFITFPTITALGLFAYYFNQRIQKERLRNGDDQEKIEEKSRKALAESEESGRVSEVELRQSQGNYTLDLTH